MRVTTVGIDLAKRTFQLHGADDKGRVLFRKKVTRKDLGKELEALDPCRIVMEACGGANYWGRTFSAMGHQVKLISPQFVKPFVKSQKNDRNDAEAIVEAASRPSMRFVPVKKLWQQDIQTLHRVREGYVKQLRAINCQIRGLASEYGVIFSEGSSKFKKELLWSLEDAGNGLSSLAREMLRDLLENYLSVEKLSHKVEDKLKRIAKEREDCQRLLKVPGVGPITATAFVSSVGDPREFKNGRQASAWLGLVPQQYSTGGKTTLVGISKRGDNYLRYLLIQGGHAVVRVASSKGDYGGKFYKWANELKKRKGANVASVAVANRNARVMWALLASGGDYKAS